MIEIAQNIWVNLEQIVSIQRNSNKMTGEIRLFVRFSNGEQYDVLDNDGKILKQIQKMMK